MGLLPSPNKRMRMIREAFLRIMPEDEDQLEALERVAMTGMTEDLMELISQGTLSGDYRGRMLLREKLGLPPLEPIKFFGGKFLEATVGRRPCGVPAIQAYKRAFKRNKICFEKDLEHWIRPEDFVSIPTRVEYAKIRPYNLGYKVVTPYQIIRESALEIGLTDCVPEDGLAVRLEYRNQPEGDMIFMATSPPVFHYSSLSDHTDPFMWVLSNKQGLWLSLEDADMSWEPDWEFIFRVKAVPLP